MGQLDRRCTLSLGKKNRPFRGARAYEKCDRGDFYRTVQIVGINRDYGISFYVCASI